MTTETSSLPAHAQCLQHLLSMYPRMTFSRELLEATQRIDLIAREMLECFQSMYQTPQGNMQRHVQDLRDRVAGLKQIVHFLNSPSETSHLPKSCCFLEYLRSCYEPFCTFTEAGYKNICGEDRNPPIPSQEKIKTLYAVAAVMGAWLFAKFSHINFYNSYEKALNENLQEIGYLHARTNSFGDHLLFTGTGWALTEKFFAMRKDPFWQENPDLYETARRLYHPRHYASVEFCRDPLPPRADMV